MSTYDKQACEQGDSDTVGDEPAAVVRMPPNNLNESLATSNSDGSQGNDHTHQHHHVSRYSSPILSRRKSSPQMDPIPSYTPTPLHLLQHRVPIEDPDEAPAQRVSSSSSSYVDYNPTPIHTGEQADDNYESPPTSPTHEYTPLLQPSKHVISCDSSPPSSSQARAATSEATRNTSASAKMASPASKPSLAHNRNVPRPVSSALAQAVIRRRLSQTKQDKLAPKEPSTATASVSDSNSMQPVMWSPKLPSEIIKETSKEPGTGEGFSRCKPANAPKPRVARKATTPRDTKNRPRLPQGISKKVPQPLRIKYLDVIINEYLNTGHKEDESYREALKEEQALASRAANKNIYANLVAGLKKKIREKAGMTTLPQDGEQKVSK